MLIEKLIKVSKEKKGAAKTISDYILNYKNDYIEISASEIAINSYVTNAFITKYVKSLGYSSFKEFKYELVKEVRTSSFSTGNLTFDLELDTYTNSILKSYIDTSSFIDMSVIKKIANKIVRKKNIYVIAVGSNSTVGHDLVLKLVNLKINAKLLVDGHLQYFTCFNADKDDLFIVFSYGGGSEVLLENLNQAKNNGATLALVCSKGVTNQIADYVINVNSPEEYSKTYYLQARNMMLMISDLIFLNVNNE